MCGLHAAKYGTRFEALEPVRQGVRDHFGGMATGAATGLSLHLGPPTGVPRLRSSPAAQPLSETRPSGQVV